MSKIVAAGVVVLLAAATAGCVTTAVEDKENMLAAAGFKVKLADTPAKIASLTGLPPHKFVQNTQGGQPSYLYADPTICKCLYYGDQTAYATYQQLAAEQRVADRRLIQATMLQDTPWNDWAPWGPWYY
ncbi:hypothetical protein [Microvirga pudoricolor]|uniref:hypothetical protein n=1 Tax=Microvirga pudoricolor TaxID=2778729 RepID=UPI00195040D2|nr:hypothetical protein [Microvirga pudoricolor]MBM6594480.1 hypothetical protein [Microvirga pudoricolor]